MEQLLFTLLEAEILHRSILESFLKNGFNLVVLQSLAKELQITVNLHICLIKSDTIFATYLIISQISCKFQMLHLLIKSKYNLLKTFLNFHLISDSWSNLCGPFYSSSAQLFHQCSSKTYNLYRSNANCSSYSDIYFSKTACCFITGENQKFTKFPCLACVL